MARRLLSPLSRMPKDVETEMRKVRHFTHTGKYNRLKKLGLKPSIPLSEIRKMASKKSKRSGVPIIITEDIKDKRAEGVSQIYIPPRAKKAKVRVKLHPILSYTHRDFVENVINHELDHAKVQQRVAERHNKRLK